VDAFVPLFNGHVLMKVARVRFDPRVQAMLNPTQPIIQSSSPVQPPHTKATHDQSHDQVQRNSAETKPLSSLSISSHKSSPNLRRPSQVYEGGGQTSQDTSNMTQAAQPQNNNPTQQREKPPAPPPLAKPSVDLLGGFDESPKLRATPQSGPVDDLIGLAMSSNPPPHNQSMAQMDPFAVNFNQSPGPSPQAHQQNGNTMGNNMVNAFDAFPTQPQQNQNQRQPNQYQNQFNGLSGF